ncbi:MAG TPA: hypothetical protein VMJ11_11595, partial [Paraburkholderia sp.]|uniref:hypothetical protein n=1 Tax=Paraburkholderia sp. TaxID=1926495 RepID=UPI002C6A5AD7
SFSLRQPLFCVTAEKLLIKAPAGFRGGLRVSDITDIELRRGRILALQQPLRKMTGGNFPYFPAIAASGTASAIAA